MSTPEERPTATSPDFSHIIKMFVFYNASTIFFKLPIMSQLVTTSLQQSRNSSQLVPHEHVGGKPLHVPLVQHPEIPAATQVPDVCIRTRPINECHD